MLLLLYRRRCKNQLVEPDTTNTNSAYKEESHKTHKKTKKRVRTLGKKTRGGGEGSERNMLKNRLKLPKIDVELKKSQS